MIISVSLALLWLVGAAGVVSATRLAYPGDYPDPFALYEAVMPGQSTMISGNVPCLFQTVRGMSENITYCAAQPAAGPIVSVVATAAQDGRFATIFFDMRGLHVGDVIRHWGQPTSIMADEGHFYVHWGGGFYGLIEPSVPSERFDYQLLIERLTVGLEPLPPAESG